MLITRATLSALALLVGVGILLGALAWMATEHAPADRVSGSRPVPLQQCLETSCIVP
jgi:hypothetical protein